MKAESELGDRTVPEASLNIGSLINDTDPEDDGMAVYCHDKESVPLEVHEAVSSDEAEVSWKTCAWSHQVL